MCNNENWGHMTGCRELMNLNQSISIHEYKIYQTGHLTAKDVVCTFYRNRTKKINAAQYKSPQELY